MFDYRPGRRQIVVMLMASPNYSWDKYCPARFNMPFETEDAYQIRKDKAWTLYLNNLYLWADHVIKHDLETEDAAPIDRPRY